MNFTYSLVYYKAYYKAYYRALISVGIVALCLGWTGVAHAEDVAHAKGAMVMLHSDVSVVDSVIRLGDIFTNVGKNSAVVIARAPEPGRKSILGMKQLLTIARYFRLAWKPESRYTRTTITRSSTLITPGQIEAEIMEVLHDRGYGQMGDPQLKVRLANRAWEIHVPADTLPDIEVRTLEWNGHSPHFSATIAAPAFSPAAKIWRLTGRIERMISVPVLNTMANVGSIIRDRDVVMRVMVMHTVPQGVILDRADLIGFSPTRTIRANQPIYQRQIGTPILVAKRSLVTIVYQVGGLRLSTQGRALDNGGKGDIIRVSNTQSHIIVEAEVLGEGQVRVRQMHQIALNTAHQQ